jgi:hypothetical protein
MRESNANQDFFQPVISTLGLLTSVLATLLPIFPIGTLQNYFVNADFIKIASFSAFLLGFILLWLITGQDIGYISFPIGVKFWKKRETDENGEFEEREPLITVTNFKLLVFFIILNVTLVCLFLFLSKSSTFLVSIIQAFVYMAFFLILISAFGIMYSFTKMKYNFDSNRENFPKTIFDTLEKNGQIQSGLEIQGNVELSFEQVRALNIMPFPLMARHVIVKTVEQPSKKLSCFVSSDGKNLMHVEEVKQVQTTQIQ